MTILTALIALVLLSIAALHAYWGLGGVWPGKDAADCARRTGGFRGVNAMPGPGPCFAVAVALLVAAIVAAAQGGLVDLPLSALLISLATLGATLVFLGRGIAGFTPAWRRLTPEQPFATFDVRYYSPLCLLIGAGFLALLVNGWNP